MAAGAGKGDYAEEKQNKTYEIALSCECAFDGVLFVRLYEEGGASFFGGGRRR